MIPLDRAHRIYDRGALDGATVDHGMTDDEVQDLAVSSPEEPPAKRKAAKGPQTRKAHRLRSDMSPSTGQSDPDKPAD